MTDYIVELVDSVSQLFITYGWVYIQDNLGNSKTGITASGGATIGRVTISMPGTCIYAAFGKDTSAGVRLYEPQSLNTLSPAPVVNQMWLIPVGQPQTVYDCPYGDGLSFNTQAELEAHILAVHYVPDPEPEPDPTPGKSIPAQLFAAYPTLLHSLWLMREKVFSREKHIKLHPLI